MSNIRRFPSSPDATISAESAELFARDDAWDVETIWIVGTPLVLAKQNC